MIRWAALLRGVNVGGSNRLPMAELRETVAALGFDDVATYIQSGNIVFSAPGTTAADEPALTDRLRAAVSEHHGLSVPVVVRSADEIVRIANSHPDADSGIDPTLLHVQFLDREPDAEAVDGVDPVVFEPDRWAVVGREIYVCYPNGSARSKLTLEVFERALGVTATARNLNTVRKLAELCT